MVPVLLFYKALILTNKGKGRKRIIHEPLTSLQNRSHGTLGESLTFPNQRIDRSLYHVWRIKLVQTRKLNGINYTGTSPPPYLCGFD